VPEIEAATEAPVSVGLLEETATSLAFRHELARRPVETSLSARIRRGLHTKVFSQLSDRPDTGEARLLHHALAAGDEAAILRLAPSAASNALRLGALRESVGYFRQALEHLPPSGTSRRAGLMRDNAWANYQMGNGAEAIDAETEALEHFAASGDIVREGDSYRRMSRFFWLSGHRAAAQDFANRAVRTLSNQRGPELAIAYSTVAQLAMRDDDYESVAAHPMRQWNLRANSTARKS
jgi:tetratricopeptide (TPR) repeat protein